MDTAKPVNMSSKSVRCNEVWPPKYAIIENGLDLNTLTKQPIVKTVEFTEPHSHVFHGYSGIFKEETQNQSINFHVPNNVDFEISPKTHLEYAKSIVKEHELPKLNKDENRLKHLFAGGIAGCVASIVTCPLDVIKTRQQSSGNAQGVSVLQTKTFLPKVSNYGFHKNSPFAHGRIFRARRMQMSQATSIPNSGTFLKTFIERNLKSSGNSSILQHYRHIMNMEGPRALYKGLGTTLVGVVPSRAIYFYAYSNSKNFYTRNFGLDKDSSSLHLVSAGSAGICCTTATSPLWVIKTKLQLHRSVQSNMSVRECVLKIWQAGGMRGFYRGMTASYAGILETIIHFVIYERLKLLHVNNKQLNLSNQNDKNTWKDYATLMAIAAMSKTTATCIAYPHEVVRTRLREETKQSKYRGFFQTLSTVAKHEGVKALYRGLGTQIIRQVPNMAIVMGTYEFLIDASSRG
uniref:solute carrier family 25 member 36-A-like n=1 Tax=Styela clava TaxID=7725 RepID=UPI001939EEA1|nr:solute carrier family 25 member 36-A-like [Styela clava]